MNRKIVVLQGHPDPEPGHFCHALAEAYIEGARAAGHHVSVLTPALVDFPLLHSGTEFEHGEPLPAIREAQAAILEAGHLVIIYPLWLGTMPALLKGYLEQVFRPGFAFRMDAADSGRWHRQLRGKSARIVITMGMPAFVYRWYFRAHSLKSLERNILGFVGIKPIRETLIGAIGSLDTAGRQDWISKLRRLGINAR